jgi:hypothetical protein
MVITTITQDLGPIATSTLFGGHFGGHFDFLALPVYSTSLTII